MKCIVCGIEGPDKLTRAAEEWDWFTRYLPETVHFCPMHKNGEEWKRLRKLADINPKPPTPKI